MVILRFRTAGAVEGLVAGLSPELSATRSNGTYVEITRAGVDKASAVRYCATKLGIDAREVVAIGDGENDLSLFAFAGVSVAPANASSRVLAAASYLTDSNNDDGVATAITALLR